MNIDEPLVFARIGHDMYERRGGWSYFKKYRTGRKMVKKIRFYQQLGLSQDDHHSVCRSNHAFKTEEAGFSKKCFIDDMI